MIVLPVDLFIALLDLLLLRLQIATNLVIPRGGRHGRQLSFCSLGNDGACCRLRQANGMAASEPRRTSEAWRMTVQCKICGVKDEAAVQAAIAGGARWIGLVFYPRSPRAVSPEEAARLADVAAGRVQRVGLFVDPDDTLLEECLRRVSLDALQLHGESPVPGW